MQAVINSNNRGFTLIIFFMKKLSVGTTIPEVMFSLIKEW